MMTSISNENDTKLLLVGIVTPKNGHEIIFTFYINETFKDDQENDKEQ